jgi:hypothetical protein
MFKTKISISVTSHDPVRPVSIKKINRRATNSLFIEAAVIEKTEKNGAVFQETRG